MFSFDSVAYLRLFSIYYIQGVSFRPWAPGRTLFSIVSIECYM